MCTPMITPLTTSNIPTIKKGYLEVKRSCYTGNVYARILGANLWVQVHFDYLRGILGCANRVEQFHDVSETSDCWRAPLTKKVSKPLGL